MLSSAAATFLQLGWTVLAPYWASHGEWTHLPDGISADFVVQWYWSGLGLGLLVPGLGLLVPGLGLLVPGLGLVRVRVVGPRVRVRVVGPRVRVRVVGPRWQAFAGLQTF